MEIGLKGYAETIVDQESLASTKGSGLLDIFATPSMIGLMEDAAKNSVEPYMEEGYGTVGMRVEIDHLAPSPIGVKVWAESELIEIDRRVLTFKVEAFTEKEKIGEGIHKRCIINNEKFLKKMEEKFK